MGAAPPHLNRIVILGSGLAAWMAAAALGEALPRDLYLVSVLDDGTLGDDATPAGIADATLPQEDTGRVSVDLDEDRLIAACGGAFSLGIALSGWSGTDAAWFHPFGSVGASFGPLAFQHVVMRLRRTGLALRFANYSLAALAAQAGRFARPDKNADSVLSTCRYGLHLDCRKLAASMRARAEAAGVGRIAGRYSHAERADDGSLLAVIAADQQRIDGELFLDCSGARARLARDGAVWRDWSDWLPCDRVVSTTVETRVPPPPYSHAEAHAAGWTRHLPLQGKSVLTTCYRGEAMNQSQALERLRAAAGKHELGDASVTALRPRRRDKPWEANCIALGAAAACIDPVGMSDLHILRAGIDRLLQLLPGAAGATAEAAEYNRQTALQLDHARDFAMLHYKLNGRRGEPFWDACREMAIPESLEYRLRLYKARGRIVLYDEEPFEEASWINLFDEQGVWPRHYNPIADGIRAGELKSFVEHVRAVMIAELGKMPTHADYLSGLTESALDG
jgi:tryptophan 7-halogenase